MENERIDCLLGKAKSEIVNLENSYNKFFEVLDELTEFIRINKDLNSLNSENIAKQMNEITKNIHSKINVYNSKVDCFNDICDYVSLYKKRISEYIDDLYKDLYGTK